MGGEQAAAAVVLVVLLSWCRGLDAELGLRVRRPPYRFDLPKNDIFHMTSAIPDNHQVSAFLYKGETKLFFYEQQKKGRGLSIAVTPCTSSVAWSVRYKNHSDTATLSDVAVGSLGPPLDSHRSSEMRVFRSRHAPPGLYVVEVSPLERQTYVQFYATEDADGPAALSVPHRSRIKLQRRHRRHQLAVSWEQSKVDPHVTNYCLVVNTRRHYQSLCEARGEKEGVAPPPAPSGPSFDHPLEQAHAHKNELASKAARANASRLGRGSELHADIVCVGKRTQYTLANLEHGKVYHFDVFAVNKKTNLSFSYGRVALKYDRRSRPTSLRDGKPARVNLRKLDGRATFKFKVGKKAQQPLRMYVMPCGGEVDAEITSQGKVVLARRHVQGYEALRLGDAVKGQRFVLKVVARNADELSRISALEVLATTRSDADFPLPVMPQVRQVHEFPGLSDCRSVTFGWVPSPDPRATRYCVTAVEDGWEDVAGPTPDQCEADKSPATRHVRVCMNRTAASNSTVMTHAVSNLKPGKSYVIQVTVKKSRGKTLSYDLLQVVTKDTCS